LWRHRITGSNVVWSMRGAALVASTALETGDPAWRLVGIADMNGDGQPDFVWRNPSSGENAVWLMNRGNHVGTIGLETADVHWDVAAVVDVNGDGLPDLVWRNSATGDDAVWFMNGLAVGGKATLPRVADLNWTIVR
jgi:hypothetical protein